MLPTVNLDPSWLGSAEAASFLDTTETSRYEATPIKDELQDYANKTDEEIAKISTNPAKEAEKSIEEAGVKPAMIDSVMKKLTPAFSGVTSENKKEIVSMIVDNVNRTGEVGTIDDKAALKESVSTLCGNFDSSMFGDFNGVNMPLLGFGLASLLTSLLCMGVDSAVAGVKTVIDTTVPEIDAPKMITKVMDTTLTGMNIEVDGNNPPSKNMFDIAKKSRTGVSLNVESMLKDVVSDGELLESIKNTSVADKLLSNYNGDSANISTYVEALKPGWDVKDLSHTSNIPDAMTNMRLSDTSTSIVFDDVVGMSKDDFMVLV